MVLYIAIGMALCAILTSTYVLWYSVYTYHTQRSRVDELHAQWVAQQRAYAHWYTAATAYEARYADLHKGGNYVAPTERPPLLR
jgi:hypothetical protein